MKMKHRCRPCLESLERRDLPSVVTIGFGKQYPNLHSVPHLNTAGTEYDVYVSPGKFKDKVDVWADNVSIVGIPDPLGNIPDFSGDSTVENADASYNVNGFQSETDNQALFTVEKRVGADHEPTGDVIKNINIHGALEGVPFTNAAGQTNYFQDGVEGIGSWGSDGLVVQGCKIHGNGQGIFYHTSDYGWEVSNAQILSNEVWNNGESDTDRFHNVYVECFHAVVEFNYFHNPVGGGSVSDRSFDLTFAYNRVVGGSVLLGMTEPEDAPSLLVFNNPNWGQPDKVFGNWFLDPQNDWSATPIWHGAVSSTTIYRPLLWYYDNTLVVQADQNVHYSLSLLSTGNAVFQPGCPQPAFVVDDNVFVTVPQTPGQPSPVTELPNHYGTFDVWNNVFGAAQFLLNGDSTFMGTVTVYGTVVICGNPYIVIAADLMHLAAGSPAVGAADAHLFDLGAPRPVFEPDGTARINVLDLGAWQF